MAGNNLTNGLSECGVTKQALQNTACIAVGNVGNTWWKVYLPVVKAIWKGRSFFWDYPFGLGESQLQRFPFAFHLDDAPAACTACSACMHAL